MYLFIILTLEEEIDIFEAKFQQVYVVYDVVYGHGSSVMKLCVQMQLMFDYGDGRVCRKRCEKNLHIIRYNDLPFLHSDGFDMVHKIFSVSNVKWGMSYHQWP